MNLTDRILNKYLGNTGFSENKPIKERIPKYSPEKLYKAEAAILVYNSYIKTELKLSKVYSESGMIDKVKVKDTGKKVWEWIKKMLQKLWTIIKETFKKIFRYNKLIEKTKKKLISIKNKLSNITSSEAKHPITKYDNKINNIRKSTNSEYTMKLIKINNMNLGITFDMTKNISNLSNTESILNTYTQIIDTHNDLANSTDVDFYIMLNRYNRRSKNNIDGFNRKGIIDSILGVISGDSLYNISKSLRDYIDRSNEFISIKIQYDDTQTFVNTIDNDKFNKLNECLNVMLNSSAQLSTTSGKGSLTDPIKFDKGTLLSKIDHYLIIVYFIDIIDSVTRAAIRKMEINISTFTKIAKDHESNGYDSMANDIRLHITNMNKIIDNYRTGFIQNHIKIIKLINKSVRSITPIV